MLPLDAGMWAYGALAVVLVIASIMDLRTAKIRNVVTYPAILAGLAGHTMLYGLWPVSETQLGLVGSLQGFAAGFLPMLAAWLAGGVGGGDAKLMGAVGALAGWRFALAALFYGLMVAAVMALFVMFRQRVVRKTLVRIWGFLYLAAVKVNPGDPAAEDSPKIAFGFALCVGAAVALIEAILRGPVAKKLWMGI